jgi:hypothetical protein
VIYHTPPELQIMLSIIHLYTFLMPLKPAAKPMKKQKNKHAALRRRIAKTGNKVLKRVKSLYTETAARAEEDLKGLGADIYGPKELLRKDNNPI